MTADTLMDLVRGLRAPFGLERSFKLSPDGILQDRFLLSLHRSAFGEEVAEGLLGIGRALRLPDEFAREIAARQERADIVHFGYEGAADHAVHKIYLENAAAVRRARALNAPDPVLVHVAYKWVEGAPARRAVTRYTWIPCRSTAAIDARIRAVVPAALAPQAARCGLDLLARATGRANARELFLMEVEEAGNPRRSFDINVYRAELHLSDIADLLAATAAAFGIAQPQLRSVLERSRPGALGHLSGGLDRQGREFVTVYYGVEAH